MRELLVAFENFEDARSLHEYLRENLEFPDHYGCNRDALYDELTSLPEETVLYVIPGGTDFEAGFMKVFRDAEKAEEKLTVRVYD